MIDIGKEYVEIKIDSRHYKIRKADIDEVLYFNKAHLLVVIGRFEQFKGYVIKSDKKDRQRAAFVAAGKSMADKLRASIQ